MPTSSEAELLGRAARELAAESVLGGLPEALALGHGPHLRRAGASRFLVHGEVRAHVVLAAGRELARGGESGAELVPESGFGEQPLQLGRQGLLAARLVEERAPSLAQAFRVGAARG